MRKIKYILATIVLASLSLQSCSEDKMDEINDNKNDPQDVESRYLITDVMTSTGFSITGSDMAFYASVYTELQGGGHNQMYNAQIRDGEPTNSATYNNEWNRLYRNLRNLKTIIGKCSEGGQESGNYHTLGIAQILTAYNSAILTDMFGDVPYSEALQPIANPQAKLDKQEDIYKEIFNLLDQAIVNLSKPSQYAPLGKQDLFFNGKNDAGVENWKKVAYGLKARYTMRLSAVSANYQEVIDNVNASFASANDEFFFLNAKVSYPFFLFNQSRSALFSSKTLYDLIQSLDANDPRLSLDKGYFYPVDGEIVLIDHAQDVTQTNTGYSQSALATRSIGLNAANAVYLLSYHELMFIKAEAEARLGQTAQAVQSLQAGIDASLVKRQRLQYPSYEREVPSGLSGQDLIKRIAQEKYISFFEIESIEAYNDLRRYQAMGETPIVLQHRNPELFPQRFTYGNSDVTANPNVGAIFGDGTYVYKEKVWWAKGTR